MKWIISDVRQKLSHPPSILRLDGGYLSKDTLSYLVEHHLYFCMAARYDWILARGESGCTTAFKGTLVDESKWIRCDVKTRLYELGLSRVISTSPHTFRKRPIEARSLPPILVEKEQDPFPGSKSQRKILRYGILERLPFSPSPQELYQFYYGRQTIEQFFKESVGPFNAGKLPSQKFRGNEAYLHLVTIAENCCVLFKKKFSHPKRAMRDRRLPFGETVLWKPLETA